MAIVSLAMIADLSLSLDQDSSLSFQATNTNSCLAVTDKNLLKPQMLWPGLCRLHRCHTNERSMNDSSASKRPVWIFTAAGCVVIGVLGAIAIAVVVSLIPLYLKKKGGDLRISKSMISHVHRHQFHSCFHDRRHLAHHYVSNECG
jgi:hypothetical protein